MDPDRRPLANDAEPMTENGMGWVRGLDGADVDRLNQATADDSAIVEEIPVERSSLGAFSVACLLFNRMIGSGVFNSSSVIFYNTQSIGASLLMWLYGAATALSGLLLYIELGLTIPRWELGNGNWISTPRSGAELVYFNFFFKAPKYLATCVFGVSFLVFGNTATNSVAFAVAVLQASWTTPTPGKIVGIALACNTFSCMLHSMSRKWGIRLNNLLGSLKLLMLFIMIVFGFVWLDRSVSDANFNSSTAFDKTAKTPTGVYRYAEALIYVIFPFGGFHQANYVLAEIRNPRKNFAWASGASVSLICVLFVVLNTLYAAIIPKEILFQPNQDITLHFFNRTIGHIASATPVRVQAASGGLRALSALGNVIVFTFTAARVKQEVAKEGVLPFSLYLASSYDFSFRHGFRRLPAHAAGHQLHTNKAPAAALALHWTVTTVLILAAVLGTAAADGSSTEEGTFSHLPGYSLLVTASTYGLDMIWFCVIGFAMLRLRLWPGSGWREISLVPHWLGVLAAVVFTATNVVPLVAIWVPDAAQPFMARTDGKVPWYASQTMAVSIVAAAGLYWVVFKGYLWQRRERYGEVLSVTRRPVFWAAEAGQRGLVLLYEIIWVRWTDWVPEEENERPAPEMRERAA
ncbi:amino acid permease-domain-containing protein [Staphylotrichum tortipilum]|uniref:Amino acid permease-domain-containing protein n=1 Tax=Staphylotrichum tortipilum TaxID=2831512 RepID=A0AAN6MJS2_9PEZI|nr:amino acid permease-domain-containing protein [Staphylotrichum longicolle]